MGASSLIKIPQDGKKIVPGQPVPDNPIIPYIEGDGIGVDITPVMLKVVDAVVQAYGGKKIHWMEVYAGEKSTQKYGGDVWLSEETLSLLKEYRLDQGPDDHPGRRRHPLPQRCPAPGTRPYQCVRPVRYFKGVPSPLKDPSKVDMVIYRENTEDIYAGIEWAAETEPCKKLIKFLQDEMGVKKIRFPNTSGIGIAGLA